MAADLSDVDVGGQVGAAWRGAVACAAAALTAYVFVLAINHHWLGIGGGADTWQDGLGDLGEVLLVLAVLPVAMVGEGLLVAWAYGLRRWVTVGLLSPLVSTFVLSSPGVRWPAVWPLVVVAAYATLGAVSTAIPLRSRSEA